MNRLLPVLAVAVILSVPVLIGSAEDQSQVTENGASDAPAQKPERQLSRECIASESVIHDVEQREKRIKEQEMKLSEREKELDAQAVAIKEELDKLEVARAEIQGVKKQEMAAREEKVNKLMETFETMSPKASAKVLAGVDEELAVMALSRLSNQKAGKVLGNLEPEQAAKLSELMAFGKIETRKEDPRNESSKRAPASKR